MNPQAKRHFQLTNRITTGCAATTPKTTMSTTGTSAPFVSPAKEIVERIRACLEADGLEQAKKYFEGMEHILSSLSWWREVKAAADKLFSDERKRLEKLELARAEASAPKVYQILPTAQSGVNVNNPHFDGSMYEVKENDNVNIGGTSNGQKRD